jgi:hypothetical protein
MGFLNLENGFESCQQYHNLIETITWDLELEKASTFFRELKLMYQKKGLGLSAGVKGFRVNSRGNINIGTGPVTYQKNLKSNGKSGWLWKVILFVIVFCLLFKMLSH